MLSVLWVAVFGAGIDLVTTFGLHSFLCLMFVMHLLQCLSVRFCPQVTFHLCSLQEHGHNQAAGYASQRTWCLSLFRI